MHPRSQAVKRNPRTGINIRCFIMFYIKVKQVPIRIIWQVEHHRKHHILSTQLETVYILDALIFNVIVPQ